MALLLFARYTGQKSVNVYKVSKKTKGVLKMKKEEMNVGMEPLIDLIWSEEPVTNDSPVLLEPYCVASSCGGFPCIPVAATHGGGSC